MTYKVICDDCVFQAEEESEKLALLLKDMHHLYNHGHDVDVYVEEG